MDFERQFTKENDNYQILEELEPKGIIVYSSGYPIDKLSMRNLFNRNNFRASVHTLVDVNGILQIMPFGRITWHSGTIPGNTKYLSVMVCEPKPFGKDIDTLRDQTRDNLVQYLTFLCRLCHFDMNVRNVIQFAGTAYENHIVTREVLKPCLSTKPYFGRIGDREETGDAIYCDEVKIISDVKENLGQINSLYHTIEHTAEPAVDAIGLGDVAMFIGGDLFKSRGISTRITFVKRMSHCIVSNYVSGSRHAYEVTFPNGARAWVNKGSLVRSALGSVS